jgi:hypothetical protein
MTMVHTQFSSYLFTYLFLDPTSLQDMQSSRNPDAVRGYLDGMACEGFTAHSIKGRLRLSDDKLDEVYLIFFFFFFLFL